MEFNKLSESNFFLNQVIFTRRIAINKYMTDTGLPIHCTF